MRTGREFFRRMVEASRDGLCVLDPSGTIEFANARMAELLGVPADDLVGSPFVDHLDERSRHELSVRLSRLAGAPDTDPGADDLVLHLVRSDGTPLSGLTSYSPLRDEDGHRIAWMYRLSENAEQQSLLESLRQREGLLATAQSIARIGSWSWDVATDSVTWSDQLYRIYNVEPSDFDATYAAFLEFVHPDDRALVEEAVGSVFSGADEFVWDARVLPRGGGVRWVRGLGRVERGPDGTPARLGGTAQDITERVEADHQAAEATRRLHLLQTMASAANQTNDLDEAIELSATGVPAFTNWLAVANLAYDNDGELEAVHDFSHLGEGWRPPPDEALAERCRLSGELEFAPVPSLPDTHSVVALPVAVDGRVVRVLELLADELPPDENSRELIEQVCQQLGQVAQRDAAARHLAEARDQAMKASRMKSEFLATMSHEIRTPMNGVIGLNDLLLRTDLDAHQRRLAEGLQGAGMTLLGIINDILDLSKIEAGKLELEEIEFDIRALFDKTADVLGGPAREKGVELVVACHPDVPQVLRGDPGRIGQVLANLGSNAVKFTSEGEVAIRASVEAEDEDEETVTVRVDVSDTGVGIAPASLESLFEAFTQADPSTTREHGGTGLGLAISRELVSALGGELSVTSTPGEGSTFTFTAPLGRGTTTRIGPAVTADPDLLHGRRVLVVDDSSTTRMMLDEQLTAWGMGPMAVSTAAAALGALRSASTGGEPFEAVVLGLTLPDGDGLSLATDITEAFPVSPPRMALIGGGEVDDATATAAGIDALLDKPIRQSELLDCLVTMLCTDAPVRDEVRSSAAVAATGRRLLVVEDNHVNQMVAVGLLEAAGYNADVVGDGAAAVEALSGRHGYAAVLMDCRMPRMDGFDATRAVRAAETPGVRVPIIAMTASALEGEHERCLAAGMDDFLTKPVDPVRLLRVVRRWTDSAVSSLSASAPAPPREEEPADDPDEVVDLERMRMLDELKRDGTSLFDRASANFVANADAQLAAIRDAVATGDAAELTARAHKLKGGATNLGLPSVGSAAEALELLGLEGTTDGAGDLLGPLEAEITRALDAIAVLQTDGLG